MFHKNFFHSLLAAVLFISGSTALALPGLSVGVMGGANLSMPSADLPAGATLSGGVSYSAGATVEAGPLEVSAIYSRYSLKAGLLGIETTTASKYLELPVLYRLGVGLASVGVGGFYGLCLDSGATGDDHNYGAVASVRVNIPGGFFADGRFNLGLKDLAGSKLSSAAVFLGFNFL